MNWNAILWSLLIILMAWNILHIGLYYTHRYKYVFRHEAYPPGSPKALAAHLYKRNDEFAEALHVFAHEHQVDAIGIVGDPETGEAGTFIFGITVCDSDNLMRAMALERAAVVLINNARAIRAQIKEEETS